MINNIFIGTSIACIILITISLLSLMSIIKKKMYNDIQTNKMSITGSIFECDQMIDEFITHEFNNYCMYNLNHLDIDAVSDKMQEKIREDMIQIIKQRISDNILNRMLLFYNVESISDIIVEKIYILVTSWVINTDNSKTEKEIEIELSNKRKNNGMV